MVREDGANSGQESGTNPPSGCSCGNSYQLNLADSQVVVKPAGDESGCVVSHETCPVTFTSQTLGQPLYVKLGTTICRKAAVRKETRSTKAIARNRDESRQVLGAPLSQACHIGPVTADFPLKLHANVTDPKSTPLSSVEEAVIACWD
jgi:hypothetical protein